MTELLSLDDFVVSDSSRAAWSVASVFADGEGDGPVFVHGPCGVGKTHLIQGACRKAGGTYLACHDFRDRFVGALRTDTLDALAGELASAAVVGIDDVHMLTTAWQAQNFLASLIDAGARVMLGAEKHPRMLRDHRIGLVSRMASGQIVTVDVPTRSARTGIVERLCADRQLHAEAAVVAKIAEVCVGSARDLQGAVSNIAAVCLASGTDMVTEDVVRQVFYTRSFMPNMPVRIETVIDECCRVCGCSRSDVLGSGRHSKTVLARALIAYAARRSTSMSYPEIARALGRPYHSTVHTAEQRFARQLEAGEEVPGPNGPIPLSDILDRAIYAINTRTSEECRRR